MNYRKYRNCNFHKLNQPHQRAVRRLAIDLKDYRVAFHLSLLTGFDRK